MVPRFLIFFCLIIYHVDFTEQKVQPNIVNLGNTMMEQLTNKTRENADTLYKNFSTYLKMLQEINDLIWSENGQTVIKGMQTFDDLEEAGGPPHLIHELDYATLADNFNWKEDKEVKHIKSVVSETKVLWEAVKDRANRLRIGTWGVDSKVEEEPAAPGGSDDSDGELH